MRFQEFEYLAASIVLFLLDLSKKIFSQENRIIPFHYVLESLEIEYLLELPELTFNHLSAALLGVFVCFSAKPLIEQFFSQLESLSLLQYDFSVHELYLLVKLLLFQSQLVDLELQKVLDIFKLPWDLCFS